MPTINSGVPQGSEVGELDRCGMVETRLLGGIRQWSQGWSDRDQDITERDEVCHGRMQAPLTGGHAPLVHCSTRWFPGVDQGVDQGWIRVDQGGSRVDQVFASRRGRQKRMGNVGAPHSCVARGGGRTCPFVIIKGRNAVPVARAGLMAQVDFPAARHEGTRAVLVANSGNGGNKVFTF